MKIGVIGAGQLGRMLCLDGLKLNNEFCFYSESASECCNDLGAVTLGSFKDQDSIERFCNECDVVTFEFENIPADVLNNLKNIRPGARSLEISQDRLSEKSFMEKLGIRTPKYQAVSNIEDCKSAAQHVGLPLVLKTRRLGYDGKGQFIVRTQEDIEPALKQLGGSELIAEEFIPFSKELSVIGVRGQNGEIAIYPLFENKHSEGILRVTKFPAPEISEEIHKKAADYISRLLNELSHVGVLTLEMFEMNGELIGNEIAPRVHNSGHCTIEATVTSQFENHIRAVTGLPLGETRAISKSVMFNIIGNLPKMDALAEIPGANIHNYQKSERAGRKIGHITLLVDSFNDPRIDQISELAGA